MTKNEEDNCQILSACRFSLCFSHAFEGTSPSTDHEVTLFSLIWQCLDWENMSEFWLIWPRWVLYGMLLLWCCTSLCLMHTEAAICMKEAESYKFCREERRSGILKNCNIHRKEQWTQQDLCSQDCGSSVGSQLNNLTQKTEQRRNRENEKVFREMNIPKENHWKEASSILSSIESFRQGFDSINSTHPGQR